MIKKLNYILIICPIILSILLIINIIKYNNYQTKNQNIINSNNNYQEKITKDNQKKEQLTNKINNLKEEKKDKIWEYDRWIKWNQEIISKIN